MIKLEKGPANEPVVSGTMCNFCTVEISTSRFEDLLHKEAELDLIYSVWSREHASYKMDEMVEALYKMRFGDTNAKAETEKENEDA